MKLPKRADIFNGYFAMMVIVGVYGPQWGHTALAEGFGKLYALRSLSGGSSLCVFDMPSHMSDSIVIVDKLVPTMEVKTPGEHSCHITLLASQAVLSDYTSGTLSLFDLDENGIPSSEAQVLKFEGSGPDPVRQTSPHIHSSWISPDGNSLVVADLGCDRLYRFDISGGRLQADSRKVYDLPSGCGPRHCAFNQDGSRLYVSTELSDELLTYSWPQMQLLHKATVNDSKPRGGGHIVLSPDGRFLYVSSRLVNDGIAVFALDKDGMPQRCGYHTVGAHPRHFAVSSDGRELVCAARDGHILEFFSIDPSSGLLEKYKEQEITQPVFVIIK